MGMVVRTNTMALNAYRQLGMNNSAVAKSLEKLSSGFRINRAGDDAAGLAISEKMKAQIKGLETASTNAQDGISLIQTAEGNLSEVHDMLNRMVELATKSANGTYTSTERKALQDEMDQLLDEVDRISQSANFNGTKLLNGTMGLNNEAITIGDSTKYQPPGAFNAGTVTVNPNHAGSSATEVKPKFTVDFADFKWNSGTPVTQVKDVTVSLQVSGQAMQIWDSTSSTFVAITLADATAGAAKEVAGVDIANALNDQYVSWNGYTYKATANGSKLNFEFQGKSGTGTNGVDTATDADKVPSTATDLAKLIPQGKVTVSISAKDDTVNLTTGTVTGRDDCPVYKIDDPVAGAPAVRAGATLELNKQMLQDGYTLKIGETTFTFTAGKAPTTITANNGANASIIVDSSLSEADLLKSVTEQFSHMSAKVKFDSNGDGTIGTDEEYTFNIGREAGTGKIEIEETVPAAGKTVGGFDEDTLKNLFVANAKETMASTKLNIIDNAKLADTEKICVDGKDYKFAKGATLADTMNNIKSTLGNDYDVMTSTIDGKGVVTVSAKTASASSPALAGSGLTLQIGDTADEFNKMNVKVADMSANGLGLEALKKSGIMNEVSAADSIEKIKTAINTVSTTRAGMGALQNRLEHTINNLDVAVENLSAANSRIRDTDMAKEMMNYTKMNVLVQSAQAMLAQANQQPQSVLQLLQ